MHSGRWFVVLCLAAVVPCTSSSSSASASSHPGRYSRFRRMQLRDSVKEMFMHAYTGYKQYAFPADELRPLTCTKNNGFGGYVLTVIDSLDALVMFGEVDEFQRMVAYLQDTLDFSRLNRKVSLFETNIRVVGGLLAGHIAAVNIIPEVYDGGLLKLAKDLGERLLPAFDTYTGIPYNEVNLMLGVDHKSGSATCPAAAGTLLLEMGLLGVLVGDCRFVEASHRALEGIWKFRSPHNLIGTIFDVFSGKWVQHDADIGASHDSFFEYLLKAYIMFGDAEWLEVWKTASFAAQKHLQTNGGLYTKVDHITNAKRDPSINSLQAFWPGLQVLYGDVESAVLSFRPFEILFDRYFMLPEDIKLASGAMGGTGYPLRPEMVESAWFLHRATGDPHYLHFGERLMHRINSTARTKCGFAAVKDVRTKQLEDKMDSFLLSETLKYLLVLFDPDPNVYFDINSPNYVLTTEAHPFPIQTSLGEQYHKCVAGFRSEESETQTMKYSKGKEHFMASSFKLHHDSKYEKPILRWWEKKNICPKPPHYMRLAGLMRDQGRCIQLDYGGSISVSRSSSQHIQHDESETTDGAKSLHFDIQNPNRDNDAKSFEVMLPPKTTVSLQEFSGGVVLSGLQGDWLAADSRSAVISLFSKDGSIQKRHDYARFILVCSIEKIGPWARAISGPAGTKIGRETVASERQRSPDKTKDEIALSACRAAGRAAEESLGQIQSRLRGLFLSEMPLTHVTFFKARSHSILVHHLCESAARAVYRDPLLLASPTMTDPEIERAVLAATLSADAATGSDGERLSETIPTGQEETFLGSTTWPQASDLRDPHLCPGADTPPHLELMAGKALFGAPLSSQPQPLPLRLAPSNNALGCRKYNEDDAAELKGSIVLVERGDCTFHRKALQVQEAGGLGLVVTNTKNVMPDLMGDYPGDAKISIPLAMLSRGEGVVVREVLLRAGGEGGGGDASVHCSLTRSTTSGLLDLRYSGVLSAASPHGAVLWRRGRAVPSFIQTTAFASALSTSYYQFQADALGAEDTTDELENDIPFSFPREKSAILLVPLTRAFESSPSSLGAYSSARGWYFTHEARVDVGMSSPLATPFFPGSVAWHIVSYDTMIGVTEFKTGPQQGLEEAALDHISGTVVRLYHQPVVVKGSRTVLRWMALSDAGSEAAMYSVMDEVQKVAEDLEGYLSREVVLLDTPVRHEGRGVLYHWLEISQWRTTPQVKRFIAEASRVDEATASSAAVVVTALSPASKHSASMPQQPLVAECDSTEACS